MKGNDVIIMQYLLRRSPFVNKQLTVNGTFDTDTSVAVSSFQKGNTMPSTGVFDIDTANVLLMLHLDDDYKDNHTVPSGWKYKVFVPVFRNRSIETQATLFDASNRVLLTFRARTHGQNYVNSDNQIEPRNELTSLGSTPTGLSTFDLNSPELNHTAYGPYPINRAVQGVEGNAEIVISNIRDGILMHTGEWPNWNTSMPMPNSDGCIHAWPEDIKQVWQILVSLGVEVRPNTFGKLPYPYKPQGILSVQQMD